MAFRGKRVMLSPDLVPATLLERLHDVLKANGAEVCLFSNPSYNSKNDFHVLPSGDNNMLGELRSKGCNVIGTECILRCAKERRPLPSAEYTCCMALDGMRIMSTGFDGSEKARIQSMVTAMCGTPLTKSSMDTDVILAKHVLTQHYKWATFTLRKPILKVDWLYQCHQAHKRVPYEQFQLPIFTGVVLCTTGISGEEQQKMAEIVRRHGGVLNPDLTNECTHLIAKSTESDKFKMATTRGVRIICVNEKWFWNSVSEKVFLDERNYPVHKDATKSAGPRTSPVMASPAYGGGAVPPPVCELDADIEIPRSGPDICCGQEMYLSGCRVHLVGFQPNEMRRLVSYVLDGGGTRYVEFNDSVTHVVVGKPSEREIKDIREYAMSGLVYIVMPSWLEECQRQKREVAVSAKFVISQSQIVLQTSLSSQGRSKSVSIDRKKSLDVRGQQRLERKGRSVPKELPDYGETFVSSQDPAISKAEELKRPLLTVRVSQVDQALPNMDRHTPGSLQVEEAGVHRVRGQGRPSVPTDSARQDTGLTAIPRDAEREDGNHVGSCAAAQTLQPAFQRQKKKIFEDCKFAFANSFDPLKRVEVVDWVNGGGGEIVEQGSNEGVRFMIYPHGRHAETNSNGHVKIVTPQWIMFCLQEGSLLDVQSHVIFQPLRCDIPLPGFETFKFVFSQYSERELVLLRNLCFILGSKHMVTRMSRKQTHLVCKVGDGEKYQLAFTWGIQAVTANWLYACVAENNVVSPERYRPKQLTGATRDAGLGIPSVSQNPATILSSVDIEPAEPAGVQPMPQNIDRDGIDSTGFRRSSAVRPKSKIPPRRVQTRAAAKCSLSSQMTGGNLDPWDELTASWANQDEQKVLVASQQLNGGSQDDASRDFENRVEDEQADDHRERVHDDTEEPQNFTSINDEDGNESDGDKGETDFTSAIEGLLAQTRKVEDEGAFEKLDIDTNRLSPDSIKLNRLSNAELLAHNNHKRAKISSSRSVDSLEQAAAPAIEAEDNMEKYEESQMGSQVVAYDEDDSEKHRIMERVRTRSMSLRSTSGSVTVSSFQYNRLMKAADANK